MTVTAYENSCLGTGKVCGIALSSMDIGIAGTDMLLGCPLVFSLAAGVNVKIIREATTFW